MFDFFFLFFCSKIKFEGNTMDRIQTFDQLVAFNEPANKPFSLVWNHFITISVFGLSYKVVCRQNLLPFLTGTMIHYVRVEKVSNILQFHH